MTTYCSRILFFPIKYVSYHRHFLSAKQRNNFVSVLFPF